MPQLEVLSEPARGSQGIVEIGIEGRRRLITACLDKVMIRLVGTAVLSVVLELRQSLARRPGASKASWASEVLFRLILGVGALGAGALSGVTRLATIRPAAVADWIGLVLFWSGIALRQWSFHTLGRYFTFIVQTSEDQPVIADGPYQVIRHPAMPGWSSSSRRWACSSETGCRSCASASPRRPVSYSASGWRRRP